MSRLMRIAVREYVAYVRTVGFWLSICLMPMGLVAALWAPGLIARQTPPASLAIVDLTGKGLAARLTPSLSARQPGSDGTQAIRLVPSPVPAGTDVAGVVAALRPYVAGQRLLPDGRTLDAAAVLHGEDAGERVAIDVWTRNPANSAIQARLSEAMADVLRRERLEKAGLDPAALSAIERLTPDVAAFSPSAAGGRVELRDQLPGFIGLGMGILLWMVVLTGAGMLLNSVIEEKTSRILDVLLTSASVPEVMAGKILGVAAVAATVLGVWLSIGAALLAATQPQVAGDLVAALLHRGLVFYFAFYFVLGYLMYATLFITIGAFCETTREAQTMLGPMMILLSVPMVFLTQSLAHPDAPLLQILSWVPPLTPFLMAARAASGPPLWQVAGTGALLVAVTGLEMLVAGRAFRAGALSSSRFDPKLFFASLIGRATI
ncbi:MAG: ABC transporter permease [Caulobacteraceae bacterium]|nr:ABC transporter permease [Caulobacteraceae bacterium]